MGPRKKHHVRNPARPRAKDLYGRYTRGDAERAIGVALAAFDERAPSPDQLEHLDDAINALLARNHGIAFVLAMGAVLHGRRGTAAPTGDSLDRLKRSFDAAKIWLDSRAQE